MLESTGFVVTSSPPPFSSSPLQIAKDIKQFYDQALHQTRDRDSEKGKKAAAVVKTFHETVRDVTFKQACC